MFWIEAISGFVSFAVNCVFLRETRGSVLLSRRAVQLTKSTGKLHAAPGDSERVDLKTLVCVSVARPMRESRPESFSLSISFSHFSSVHSLHCYRTYRLCHQSVDRSSLFKDVRSSVVFDLERERRTRETLAWWSRCKRCIKLTWREKAVKV